MTKEEIEKLKAERRSIDIGWLDEKMKFHGLNYKATADYVGIWPSTFSRARNDGIKFAGTTRSALQFAFKYIETKRENEELKHELNKLKDYEK